MIARIAVAPVLIALLALCAPTLSAQPAYVYEFLRNDNSARAAAMGGAFVTITEDATSLFYNPAALATIDTPQAGFTFFKHLLDINSGTAVVALPVEDFGPIGVGVTYTTYGDFDRTTREGVEQGSFGAGDLQIVAGWGTDLGEGFLAGVSGEAIISSIADYSSSALALSGGLMYVDTARRVQAGLAILHLGGQLASFGVEGEPLPVDLKVGVSHQLRGLPLLIALNFSRLLDDEEEFLDRFAAFSIGGEFTISRPIRLRLGYDNRVRQDVPFGSSKGLSGFSGGLGIVVSGYRFDYGFKSMDRLGGLHRVSLAAEF